MKRAAVLLVLLTACTSHPSALTVAWQWHTPAPAYAGMPATSGQRIAVTYGHSYLAVFERGRLRWQTRFVGLRDVAPTFHGEQVLAATDTGVAAFAVPDGALRWHRELGDRASTPVAVGDRTVVTMWDGRVVMLDKWSAALPGPSLGPPAAAGGLVLASWEGGVVAFDASDGRVRWQRDIEGADTSAPAVFGELAVMVGGDRRVHGLDLRTGRERWSVAMNGAGSPEAPPAVSGGLLAAVDRLGHLKVINGDGEVRWSADGRGAVVRSGPAWVDDAVAVPLDDGKVMVATRRSTLFHDPPGRDSGVAASGNEIIVATREGASNGLAAFDLT